MIFFNRKGYKKKAREIYKEKPFIILLVTFVSMVLSQTGVSIDISYHFDSVESFVSSVVESMTVSPLVAWMPFAAITILLLSVVIESLLYPMICTAVYYLKQLVLGIEKPDPFYIIHKGLYTRVFVISVLKQLGIAIGMLFLVLPGFYLRYAWRYVNMIAVDEPDLPIIEVFKKSMDLVAGYKVSLLFMDVSFIGWYIVAVLVSILSFNMLSWVASLVLSGYILLTDVVAYCELSEQVSFGNASVE